MTNINQELKRLHKKIRKLEAALEIVTIHSGKTEALIRKQFEVVSETIPVPLIISSPDGNIVFSNFSAHQVFGYSSENSITIDSSSLFHVPKDRALFQKSLSSQGEVYNFRTELRKLDGSTFSAALFSHMINFDGQNCFLTVIHDLSEMMHLESKLRQAHKMEAIGTLAGGIAHDFNNILAAILGFTEMAREDTQSGSTVAMNLDKVLEAGHRAKDLIRKILFFSRQDESGRISLQPVAVLKEAIEMLRPSLPTTIEITLNIDSKVGLILADPTQIHQIIINLVTNAFHALEETGGTLDIALKEIDLSAEDLARTSDIEAGTFIQLSICDSGPGIAQDIKDKIFDPYFTTKETGKGTGMGLAIVHGIVKSYGGFISLYSKLGEGSAFHVYLPVVEKGILHKIEVVDQIPLGNERILFVDDEEILTEMTKNMLERLGYHVTVRKNSLEALITFQDLPHQFDLIITDQTMPGMTGADLAKRILQIRPDMPIILCTGYSTIMSEKKAQALGIKGFLLKPFTTRDIAVLIRKVLDCK